MSDNDFPQALARKWAEDYSEYLFLTIALRDLVCRKINRGMIRGLVTSRGVSLLETADQLATYGYRPALALAGAESELWSQTVRYASQLPWQTPPASVPIEQLSADLSKMQSLWNHFESFVARLPADFCESSLVLASGQPPFGAEGHGQMFGCRVAPTAVV